jgi:hypothetical protein
MKAFTLFLLGFAALAFIGVLLIWHYATHAPDLDAPTDEADYR